MKSHGFTLLELLITFLILIILLTICIPSFSSQIQRTKTKTAALELYTAIQATRTSAVSHNKRAVLKSNRDWSQGWEMFNDLNSNGLQDETESSILIQNKLDGVKVTANMPVKNYISFIGTGESRMLGQNQSGAFQAGTIIICAEKIEEGYKLILARSGRVRMNDATQADCNGN